MNWSSGVGVDAAIGLSVGYKESVALRLSRDSGAYLAIGDGVEIILAQSHVAALHEQSAAVLGDMIALDTAQDQVVTANAVGDQAATTAEYARKQADAAMAVGATQEAQDARAAADKAADAAVLVQTAVCAALDALQTAEESIEAAGEAAAASALAVGAATADDQCTSVHSSPDDQVKLVDLTNQRFSSPKHPNGFGTNKATKILAAVRKHLCP